MIPPSPHLALALLLLAPLAGCDAEHDNHAERNDHADHNDHETTTVTFDKNHGLRLSPEVLKALDVRVAEAAEHPLAAELRLTAQVYMTTPAMRASARVPAAEVEAFGQATPATGRLLRVDRSTQAATGFAELIYEFDTPPSTTTTTAATTAAATAATTINLTLTGKPATVLAVPPSAVLDGAAGAFVYVANDDAWLRTPVRTGARSATHVEITDGLRSGDHVIATPVEQLWLTELRLTRGGGHSH
ncbi:MAG: efflux RND transporter periplasmic adaptor subunit [Opitutaceae bacterium]|jgi:hypothetical protein|nr:efflux RND transporter periplasmic adaptor subunit [Opitutaceae bacterium]